MIELNIIGNLGKDAVVNTLENGKKVINFSVCHSEKFKNASGQEQTKNIWVECAKWGETTGVAPYLKKGVKVYVKGKPESKAYTTQEGEVRSSITVTVLSIELLGGNNQQPASTSTNNEPANYSTPTETPYGYNAGASNNTQENVEDLPF